MKRRDFITLLGGAAMTWPLGSRAQQLLIGFLSTASAEPYAKFIRAFHLGLGESGFAEGRNVAIDYRWADGEVDRLPALATELIRAGVSVIAAVPASSALAAKAATTTIPIIFMSGPDPVRNGLVASLNRPGGNATGTTTITSELAPKRLEIMRELRPDARAFAFLTNSSNSRAKPDIAEMQAAATQLKQQLVTLAFSSLREVDTAFAGLAQQGVGAVIVGADPLFNSARTELAALAVRHGMPAMFPEREYVKDGGLMSYGASLTDAFRQVGIYTGRVLKGEHPSDLPVMQPTKFELAINLKTAKALGLTVPPLLLARADEVIE